ncbi:MULTISPECIES: hypothetical protein [Burkholderia]|uniref:DUF2622 domain-containing protein n=1 Tax=Burkholderia glumae TaxID=337 RepID=A0AAP9Y327_BURGL|nr:MULTISPECIES: hypothetical protein [Burkholderia]AJY66033.1 hypothetical protein KS03_2914 [Burkholderia glumae LMG 2196 = ATCC 33617]PNL01293.1 hypothetical protein CEQ24_019965 [Burkholderia glumae]QPQ93215.1 hypothetical protein I6H06_13110 [Burkholderia glumae]QQM91582.1 hypothetical protein I6G78_04640 [Burkholderia glumae]UVS90134.1 hypothetical protein EFP17_10300 [Burkholderia glumae]
MPYFTVRVVLHDIPNKHHATYVTLHEEMEKGGFEREIVGKNGTYQLPPAEYLFNGTLTAVQVQEKATAIANKVHAKNGVLVTQAAPNGHAWCGLDTV